MQYLFRFSSLYYRQNPLIFTSFLLSSSKYRFCLRFQSNFQQSFHCVFTTENFVPYPPISVNHHFRTGRKSYPRSFLTAIKSLLERIQELLFQRLSLTFSHLFFWYLYCLISFVSVKFPSVTNCATFVVSILLFSNRDIKIGFPFLSWLLWTDLTLSKSSKLYFYYSSNKQIYWLC